MTRLVADIGGTNARFALSGSDERPVEGAKLPVVDYAGIVEAAQACLRSRQVEDAVFAVATPVVGDRVAFTNSPWSFSIEGVRKALHLERLTVINDFLAQAFAVPVLAEDERVEISSGVAAVDAAIGVIGPGTGLGVAALMPASDGWQAFPSEVEGQLKAFFGAFPAIDRATDLALDLDSAHAPLPVLRRPKNSGPDHWVPVMARATAERLR